MQRANPHPVAGDEIEIRTEERRDWRRVRVIADLSTQFVWQDEADPKQTIGFILYTTGAGDWQEIPQ